MDSRVFLLLFISSSCGQVFSAPSNLNAHQNGIESIIVEWDPPIPGIQEGYVVIYTDPTGDTRERSRGAGAVQYEFNPSVLGMYEVSVRAEFVLGGPETAGPVEVTLLGPLPPSIDILSPTATSVTVSWSQPEFSLPVSEYTLVVSRVTGTAQSFCSESSDNHGPITIRSDEFETTMDGLIGASLYDLMLVANVDAFGLELTPPTETVFSTLNAVPATPPRDIEVVAAARTVDVSWRNLLCVNRNGDITGYSVLLAQLGGPISITENVSGRNFFTDGLTPDSNYSLIVAAINSEGVGVFSDTIFIATDPVPSAVTNFTIKVTLTSIVLTWSAPEEPNGLIIFYEVNYRVNDGELVTASTASLGTTFTISPLTPGTNVTEISVSASSTTYEGERIAVDFITTLKQPPVVPNIELEAVSASALLVTWDTLDLPELSHYVLYYSPTLNTGEVIETAITLDHSAEYVLVRGLLQDVEYQFQLVAVADLTSVGLGVVSGERVVPSVSALIVTTEPPEPPALTESEIYTRDVSLAVIVTFVLTSVLVLIIFIAVACCLRRRSKLSTSEPPVPNQPVYSDINSLPKYYGMPMQENEAYSQNTFTTPYSGVTGPSSETASQKDSLYAAPQDMASSCDLLGHEVASEMDFEEETGYIDVSKVKGPSSAASTMRATAVELEVYGEHQPEKSQGQEQSGEDQNVYWNS